MVREQALGGSGKVGPVAGRVLLADRVGHVLAQPEGAGVRVEGGRGRLVAFRRCARGPLAGNPKWFDAVDSVALDFNPVSHALYFARTPLDGAADPALGGAGESFSRTVAARLRHRFSETTLPFEDTSPTWNAVPSIIS